MKETCPIGHLMEKDPDWSSAMQTQYFVCKICRFHRKATKDEILEHYQNKLNTAFANDDSHTRSLSQNA